MVKTLFVNIYTLVYAKTPIIMAIFGIVKVVGTPAKSLLYVHFKN